MCHACIRQLGTACLHLFQCVSEVLKPLSTTFIFLSGFGNLLDGRTKVFGEKIVRITLRQYTLQRDYTTPYKHVPAYIVECLSYDSITLTMKCAVNVLNQTRCNDHAAYHMQIVVVWQALLQHCVVLVISNIHGRASCMNICASAEQKHSQILCRTYTTRWMSEHINKGDPMPYYIVWVLA